VLRVQIQVTEQAGEITDVKLRLITRLDREQRSVYQLKIVATDGGEPAKSAQMLVSVVVVDANDNHPVFEQSVYSIEIREDTEPGASLVQVHASDADEGPNGVVTYSLPEHVERSYGHIFRVDEQTGVVYLRAPIDYERASVYQLSISATDNGTPSSLPVFTKVSESSILLIYQSINK
jgi:hypothetical protein